MTWRGLDSKVCDFTYRMVWHERANKDAGLTWLRKMILQTQLIWTAQNLVRTK